MPKLNICIVGLAKDLTDQVCGQLAADLELYYANVEKILEFELFDYDNIERLCGKDYLVREERSVIRRLCTYEDTLINLNYFNLNNEEILNIVKEHCLLIYLHMAYNRFIEESNEDNSTENKKILDATLFEDRDNICRLEADIVVDCKDDSAKEVTKNVANHIINYYT